ncbi:hypothetical protein AGABI1DRAFT_124275 [Agaricus bisporus var. burnettii JB137-S8]|uniref:F-box domain-containing protein n=1 Tax=Agaricus bisporus var. burnettii (strain JB137-S8 / ATCC MYA-4627 / FGSC 10392) TaxID=597362 RepID=K5WAN8_AGABU|nr:uncharacterized protein AGABI1DRAFT_124275 [Agaricus bisporus var. burnettii JB137-S8]EKM83949.1 hypothetical protein AGABI1DRAFT_124275 [Agaricus bisporus var. burnettii JB137-S8]
MSSFLTSISDLLPAFCKGNGLAQYSKQYPSCFFLRVPLHVYLDHIFPCLSLEDIICLRRVNKALFLITHEPSIWGRFLQRMNHHPAVNLRPDIDYTNNYYEIEQIVSRTVSLDDNWRNPKPKVIDRFLVETHYQVLDMVLLPGGKYLCASIKDRGNFRYYIALYVLDHPSGPQAIARVPVHTKAFKLTAKYLRVNGQYGIIVSCVRRRYATGAPVSEFDDPLSQNLPDISQFSGEHTIDGKHPYFSEVLVFFTPLCELEYLCDPYITWGSEEHRRRIEVLDSPPLRFVSSCELDRDVSSLAMFTIDNEAWLTFVVNERYIVFFRCAHHEIITVECTENEEFRFEHIKAILPLPRQRQILVVRQCIGFEVEEWVVELYPFPTHNQEITATHGIVARQVPPNTLIKATISDPDASLNLSTPLPKFQSDPIPPISIFFEHDYPSGLFHFCLWPMYEQTPDGHINYIPRYTVIPTEPPGGITPEYEAEFASAGKFSMAQSCHITDPEVAHVLPGGYRAIFYTTKYDDLRASPSMIKLRRYISPEIQDRSYPEKPADNSLSFLRKTRRKVPNGIYGTIDIPVEDSATFGLGISAITWDESIGRICVAIDGELCVRILDMAKSVEPDVRFDAWKERMSQEIVEQGCWNVTKECIHTDAHNVPMPGGYNPQSRGH